MGRKPSITINRNPYSVEFSISRHKHYIISASNDLRRGKLNISSVNQVKATDLQRNFLGAFLGAPWDI